jgi:predicted HAD superfamily Cof-like phosphohydrolase
MQTLGEMLDEFHRRPGTDRTCDPPEIPMIISGVGQRLAFIREEVHELDAAIYNGDIVALSDALADIVYTAYGLAWRCGIPLDEIVAEVHRSNMTKTPALGDGKSVKGDDYSPPRIRAILTQGR